MWLCLFPFYLEAFSWLLRSHKYMELLNTLGLVPGKEGE